MILSNSTTAARWIFWKARIWYDFTTFHGHLHLALSSLLTCLYLAGLFNDQSHSSTSAYWFCRLYHQMVRLALLTSWLIKCRVCKVLRCPQPLARKIGSCSRSMCKSWYPQSPCDRYIIGRELIVPIVLHTLASNATFGRQCTCLHSFLSCGSECVKAMILRRR